MPNINPIKAYVDDLFNLIVEFDNGEVRKVNLKDFIHGKSALKTNLALSKRVFIEDGVVISWPNGISIDPEHVYEDGEKIVKTKIASFVDKMEKHC
jgi:hypothetical protein